MGIEMLKNLELVFSYLDIDDGRFLSLLSFRY